LGVLWQDFPTKNAHIYQQTEKIPIQWSALYSGADKVFWLIDPSGTQFQFVPTSLSPLQQQQQQPVCVYV
jgi:hypothetical protein